MTPAIDRRRNDLWFMLGIISARDPGREGESKDAGDEERHPRNPAEFLIALIARGIIIWDMDDDEINRRSRPLGVVCAVVCAGIGIAECAWFSFNPVMWPFVALIFSAAGFGLGSDILKRRSSSQTQKHAWIFWCGVALILAMFAGCAGGLDAILTYMSKSNA
jgi:hypothetical protein